MSTRKRRWLLAALAWSCAAPAEATSVLFAHHAAPSAFWRTVERGFDDACAQVGAECEMRYAPADGALDDQLANIEAAIEMGVDVLVTSIVDDRSFDAAIERASDAGITVIAANVDDREGALGNARAAFVGQNFRAAGHRLGGALAEQFPKEGPIHAVIGISAPGENWSEERGGGVIDFLEEYRIFAGDRELEITRLETATDGEATSDRFFEHLARHPETNVYFDTGMWGAAIARRMREEGLAPGSILIGGFDLAPDVLEQMRAGYIQAQIDQQPYMQGYMPVIQGHLAARAGLTPADVDTGRAVVGPNDVDAIEALSQQGLR